MDVFKQSGESGGARFWRGTASVPELHDLLARFIGTGAAHSAFDEYARSRGGRWPGRTRAGLEQLAVVCSEPSEENWIAADVQTGEGFFASRYGHREPSCTRRLTAGGRTVTFVTALGCAVALRPDTVLVDGVSYPL